MGRPRKTHTPEEIDAQIAETAKAGLAKRRPRTAVLERRLQNPFGEPSMSVPFVDPRLSGRWFNDAARPGQIHRAKELGWEPVTSDMLTNLDALGSHELNVAQQITRGDRGQEVLMYMPTRDRDQVQAAKTKENNRRMGSPNVQKKDLVEAMGAHNPDSADLMDKAISLHADTHDFVETRQIVPEGEG